MASPHDTTTVSDFCVCHSPEADRRASRMLLIGVAVIRRDSFEWSRGMGRGSRKNAKGVRDHDASAHGHVCGSLAVDSR